MQLSHNFASCKLQNLQSVCLHVQSTGDYDDSWSGCNKLCSTHQNLCSICRGNYDGPEPQRLAVLKYAAHLGASHVDVELKVATYFFAGDCSNLSAKGHSALNTLYLCSVALHSLLHLQAGILHLEGINIMLKIFRFVSL